MSIEDKCEHTFVVYAGQERTGEGQFKESYVCVAPIGQNNTLMCGERFYGRSVIKNRKYIGADSQGNKFYYKRP